MSDNLDLTKLTPAPWRRCSEAEVAQLHGMFPDKVRSDDVVIERPPQSRQEEMDTFFHALLVGAMSEADADFCCLARNFADVCHRRGWGVRMGMARPGWWVVNKRDGIISKPFDTAIDAWAEAVRIDKVKSQEGSE